MSCVCPIDAWYAQRLNESGKRGVVFNIRDGFSDMPVQLPCGKCVGCARDRAMVWSLRMYHEASLHKQNCFVTLTYADPPPEVLDKRHLQRFFKRLRRECKFRYFACGEYGSLTHRPHYHVAMFGQDFLGGAFEVNDTLYSHPVLVDAWSHGLVSVGELTMASCMYVCGYVAKKIGDPDTFNLMSRRPGIGHAWLDRYGDDLRRTGVCVVEGREFAVPKKYLEWSPEELSELIKERKRFLKNMTPDEKVRRRSELPARELNYKARIAMKGDLL